MHFLSLFSYSEIHMFVPCDLLRCMSGFTSVELQESRIKNLDNTWQGRAGIFLRERVLIKEFDTRRSEKSASQNNQWREV